MDNRQLSTTMTQKSGYAQRDEVAEGYREIRVVGRRKAGRDGEHGNGENTSGERRQEMERSRPYCAHHILRIAYCVVVRMLYVASAESIIE